MERGCCSPSCVCAAKTNPQDMHDMPSTTNSKWAAIPAAPWPCSDSSGCPAWVHWGAGGCCGCCRAPRTAQCHAQPAPESMAAGPSHASVLQGAPAVLWSSRAGAPNACGCARKQCLCCCVTCCCCCWLCTMMTPAACTQDCPAGLAAQCCADASCQQSTPPAGQDREAHAAVTAAAAPAAAGPCHLVARPAATTG